MAPYHEVPALGVSCVPYARERTGVTLRGDAYTWWDHAAGLYARGNQPAAGAILVLNQSDRLQSGHVAVVSHLIGPRQILVDHANWISNEVVTNMPVIDVSPANDWTALRFWYDPAQTYGAIYQATGFIYAAGTPAANATAIAQRSIPQGDTPQPGDAGQTVVISGSGVFVTP